jgi:hypothetical protein
MEPIPYDLSNDAAVAALHQAASRLRIAEQMELGTSVRETYRQWANDAFDVLAGYGIMEDK